MTLFEKFEQKIFNETGSFGLSDDNSDKYCHFIQSVVGNARYVYCDVSWHGCRNSKLNLEYKLFAIIVDNMIYTVNKYMLDIKKWEGNNIKSLIDVRNEMNEEVVGHVFPKFYENLSTDSVNEHEIYINCKQEARNYILDDAPIKDTIKSKHFSSLSEILTLQDVADILCGLEDQYELALKKLEKDPDWNKRKVVAERIITYAKDPELVADWELAIVKGINSVDAKTINVEFELHDKKASGKMEPRVVLRVLKDNDAFNSYDFVTTTEGRLVFTGLCASEYCHDKNKITCENITKITYGRKTLYERK